MAQDVKALQTTNDQMELCFGFITDPVESISPEAPKPQVEQHPVPAPQMGVKKVTIHTDGACEGNPGPGGWAAVLQYAEKTREIAGGEPATTNNRMELEAAIQGLAALNDPSEVDLFTDSQYVKNGITQWIKGWKARGWKTKEREPVKNEEYWKRLDALTRTHKVHWHWVKGHAGHRLNERCDELAREQVSKIRRSHTPADLSLRLKAFRREINGDHQ